MIKRPIADILMRDSKLVENFSQGVIFEKPISYYDNFPEEFLETLKQYTDKQRFLHLVLKELQESAIDEFLVTKDFRNIRTIQLSRLFLCYPTKDLQKLTNLMKKPLIHLIVDEIKHLRNLELKHNIKLSIEKEDEEVLMRIFSIGGFSKEKDG